MSVSMLSLTRPLGSVSGLLPVASLLSLALLLLKAAKLYLHSQWLLKVVQRFPSPPSHWLFGHIQEVGRGWTRDGRAGWASKSSNTHPALTALAGGEGCPEQRNDPHGEGLNKVLWIVQW